MKRFLPVIFVLTLAILACSLPGLSTAAPPAPVTEPPVTEPPVTEPPVVPPPGTAFLPSGFVVTDNASRLMFYSPTGALTNTLALGSDSYVNRYSVHIAGGTSAGLPPVDYFLWRGSDPVILENMGGVETLLMYQPDFFRMAGAPATPYFAYTTAVYTDAGLLTRMYFGAGSSIASSTPLLDLTDPGGYALKPLAFRVEGGVPNGIWYTGCLYGIGGDLVFDPCNRLYFLDLTTGAATEILGDGFNPSSISPDGAWVGYASTGGGQPIQFLNLNTGEWNSFPAWPLNDRGSGEAFFSPDSRYVAWMEASGYRMDEPITFQTNVRVGTTDGVEIGQYLDDTFDVAAGFPVLSAIPVGWLDNDSILIQVGGSDWTQNAVLRLDIDGTITYLAPGYFIALTYP